MSRSDASAWPNRPADGDVYGVRSHFRYENDEFPTNDDAALEDAMWPLLAGEVIQPRCMCGKWASVGECPDCQREIAQWEYEARQEEKHRRDREAWKNFPGFPTTEEKSA